jgi:ATP-dependent protease ClpP protease subunit
MHWHAHGEDMSTQFLSFSAEINPSTTETLISAMAQLCNTGATEINLLLSTPGGSVTHGFNVYNVLRALPAKIITHNVGNVDSIGNVIFLAGVERRACPNSTFMFHGVEFDVTGSVRLVDNNLREYLDSIAADHTRIGAVIGQHTGLKQTDVVDLFKEARTKDAQWAQRVGMVHTISEPKVSPGVTIHSLVFKR